MEQWYPRETVDHRKLQLIYWASSQLPEPALCSRFFSDVIHLSPIALLCSHLSSAAPGSSLSSTALYVIFFVYLFVSLHVPVVLYPSLSHCGTCITLFCTFCLDLQQGYSSVKQYVVLYTEKTVYIYYSPPQHSANKMIPIDGPHSFRWHFLLQHNQPLKTERLGQQEPRPNSGVLHCLRRRPGNCLTLCLSEIDGQESC